MLFCCVFFIALRTISSPPTFDYTHYFFCSTSTHTHLLMEILAMLRILLLWTMKLFSFKHTHTYTIKNARIYAYTKTLTSVHIRILKQLRFISCSFCLRKMLQFCFNRFKKELQRSSCITQWGNYL